MNNITYIYRILLFLIGIFYGYPSISHAGVANYTPVSCSNYSSSITNGCNQCFEMPPIYEGGAIYGIYDTFTNSSSSSQVMFGDDWGSITPRILVESDTQFDVTLGKLEFPSTLTWNSYQGRPYTVFNPSTTTRFIQMKTGDGIIFRKAGTGLSRNTPFFALDAISRTQEFSNGVLSPTVEHKECGFAMPRWCGDGVKEALEACDLGTNNGKNGQTCDSSCQIVPPIGGTFDLSLKKYVNNTTQDAQDGSPFTLSVSTPFTYMIRVRNEGPQTVSGLTTVSDPGPAMGVDFVGIPSGNGWNCSASGRGFTCTSSAIITMGDFYPDIIVSATTTTNTGTFRNLATVANPNENSTNNYGNNNTDPANVIVSVTPGVCTPGSTTGTQTTAVTAVTAGLCPTGQAVGGFTSTVSGTTTNYSWSCNGSPVGGLCVASFTPTVTPGVCTPGSTTGTQTTAVTAVTAGLCPTGQAVGGFTSTVSGTTTNYSWSCNGSPVGGLCVASFTPTVTPGVCTSLTASVTSQTVPVYSSVLTCTAGVSAGASPTFLINCGNGQIINAASGACNYTAFGTNSASCSVNGQTGTDIPNACRVNITSTTGGGGGPGTCKELSFSPISNVNSTLSIGMSCTSTVAANPNPTFEIDCGNGQTISGNTGICTYSTAGGANFPYTTTCRVNGSTQGGLSTPPGTMAPGSCIQSIGYSAGAPLPPGGGGGGSYSYCGNGIVDSWTKTFSTGSQIPGATCTSIYRNESVTTNGVTTNVSVFDHYDCIVTTQETCDAGWLNGSPLNNLLCVNCQTQTPTTITNPSSNPLLISYYPSNLTRPQGLTVNNYQWIVGNNVPVFDPGDKFTISSPYPTILVGYSATIANISNLLSPNPATVSNPFGANECIGAGSVDFGSGPHSCIASKSLFTVTAGGVATPSYGGTGQKFMGNSSSITGAAEDVNPPLSSGSAVLQNNFTIGIGFLREPLQVRVARQAVSNTAGGNAYIGVKTGYSVNAITNEFLSSIQTGNFVVTSSASATADALSGADSANVTSTSQSVAVGVNGTSLIPVDVQVSTMSDFNFVNFAKLGDAGNIYTIKKGTVTIDGDLQLKGIGTVLIEEGALIINGNITYEDANSSWAFIVVKPSTSGIYAGTAIQIKNTVDTISGVYMALAGEMIGSSASIVQLSVDGNIYANIAKLVNSRTFIRATEGSTALSTGVTINYSTRAFKNPPPLLSKYLEQYTLRKISR